MVDHIAVIYFGGNYQYERWKNKKRELAFWKKKITEERILSNNHYKYFYTTHFDLNESY